VGRRGRAASVGRLVVGYRPGRRDRHVPARRTLQTPIPAAREPPSRTVWVVHDPCAGREFRRCGSGLRNAAGGLVHRHAGRVAVAATVALWWIYFDRIDIEAVEALAKPGVAAQRPFVIWLFAHMPVAFGLALAGAGVDLLLHEQAAHSSTPSAFIFVGGQVIFVLAEAVICATAVGAGPPQLRLTHGGCQGCERRSPGDRGGRRMADQFRLDDVRSVSCGAVVCCRLGLRPRTPGRRHHLTYTAAS